jgi:hypothetical protein
VADEIFEMLWDCSSCGTRGLLGKTMRACPNCGAPQDPTKRYFPPEGQYTAVLNTAYDGADWACGSCTTPNGAKASFCKNCGTPKDGNKEVARRADQLDGKDVGAAPVVAPRSSSPLKWVALGVLALAVGLGLVMMLWKRDITVVVQGHAWSRSVDVESLQPRSESAWCSSMPVDAYSVAHHREVRSTRQVPDGQDCHMRNVDRGDGTFARKQECTPKTRDEPVYDDKCTYLVNRWQVSRTVKAGGAAQVPPPVWPPVQLAGGLLGIGGDRQGARHETYTVHLAGPNQKTYDCDVPEATWTALRVGDTRPFEVRALTGGAVCGSLTH